MKTSDVISLISKIRQKVNSLIEAEMAAGGMEGIAVSHGDIIFSLLRKQKMTMAEIAAKISKDKSTVTALIDKLVRLGYVKKERDSEDTRVVYVMLTDKGRALEPVFESISVKVLEVFYQDVSAEEKEELLRLLTKIDANL